MSQIEMSFDLKGTHTFTFDRAAADLRRPLIIVRAIRETPHKLGNFGDIQRECSTIHVWGISINVPPYFLVVLVPENDLCIRTVVDTDSTASLLAFGDGYPAVH